MEAGELEVDIELKFTNYGNFVQRTELHVSPQTTKKLSDNFVSIEFTPVAENLFLGFEYSPII